MINCELDCDLDYDLECEFDSDLDSNLDSEKTDCNTIQTDNFFEIEEIRSLCELCVAKYFENKISLNGDEIDKSIIRKYIDMVVRTNIIDAVDKAYALIKKNESKPELFDIVNDDVKYIVGLIHQIQRIVPQEFVGGILLMHLELIEGIC